MDGAAATKLLTSFSHPGRRLSALFAEMTASVKDSKFRKQCWSEVNLDCAIYKDADAIFENLVVIKPLLLLAMRNSFNCISLLMIASRTALKHRVRKTTSRLAVAAVRHPKESD